MPRKKENKQLLERGGKLVIPSIGRNLPPFNNNNNNNNNDKQPGKPKKPNPRGALSHTFDALKDSGTVILGKPPLFPYSTTVLPSGPVQNVATAVSTALIAAHEERRKSTNPYGGKSKKRR